MNQVVMYTIASCAYCRAAEQLLRNRGVGEISFIRIDLDPMQREEMVNLTGRRTVPQIFIGKHHVGGFDDLQALDRAGGLNQLLHPGR